MYGNKKSHNFDDTNIAPLIERNASWASQDGLINQNSYQITAIRPNKHPKYARYFIRRKGTRDERLCFR